MSITAQIVADANSRMAKIADDGGFGDARTRLAAMAEIWRPIAESAAAVGVPADAEGLATELGADFIGVASDGGLIAWGNPAPIPGTAESWRPLVIRGTGPPAPTIDL